MNARTLLTSLVLLGTAGLSLAADPPKAVTKQEAMKQYMEKFGPAGPEHNLLKPLLGTWDAKVSYWVDPSQPPMTSEGALTRRAVLGGRFIQEDFNGTFAGQPYTGLGTIGYDRAKKQFVNSWIDSMSTAMMNSTGTYDEASKTFTYTSQETCPITGKPVSMKDVVQILGPDEQKITMYQKYGEEPETKMMEIALKRKN